MKHFFYLSLSLGILLSPGIVNADLLNVIKVEGKTVYVGAGADRGIQEGMVGEVYRKAEPIIHPVTGENLGAPSVKIAEIEITKTGPTFASGRYSVRYAPVEVGDVVVGLELIPTSEEKIKDEIAEARAEVKVLARGLANEIKSNQKAISDLRRTLRRIGSSERRLKTVINAVTNMRERMVSLEDRMQQLQTSQAELIERDTAEVETMMPADVHELGVLRRTEDEEIYLMVGDRSFRLSFEENRLIEEQLVSGIQGGTALVGEDPVPSLFEDEPPPKEETPWYIAYWWIVLLGPLGAVVLLVLKMMKRKAPAEADEDEEDEAEEEFAEVDDEMMPEEIPEPEEVEAADAER